MRCPQSNAEVEKVENYWIGPEHGQLPPPPSDPQAKPEAEVKPVKRRIFLSYGHDEHAGLAERLKKDLEQRGHKVWFDKDRLKPGGDWEVYIEEGLRWTGQDENGCALLLMTPHSVRRPNGYCLNEVARAVERGMFTLPVMVVQVEPPLSIARLQWFDMTKCVPLDGAGPHYEDRREVLIQALESGKVDFEGAQARLLHWLKPIEFSPDILHHLQHFQGREWLLGELRQWLEKPATDPKARVFWITGAPGVGKTALSIWLANKAVPEIKAWHLCQYNHEINKDPRRCVASIACYLSQLLPDYFEKLKTVDLESTSGMSANTLFSEILVKPLTSIPPPTTPVVILIDALDEAMQSNGKNELANFIGSEFHKTPEWLRLIVTSRPVPEVETPLSRFDPWRLDTRDERNFGDIEVFVRHRLSLFASRNAQVEAAIQAIKESSEGIFLYAWYVCDEIAAGRLDITRPETFPKGLAAVYQAFFQRQYPDPKEYETLFVPVFEMMAAAREPLTLAEFQEHFQWTGRRKKRFREGVGAIFRVRGEDGTIEPFHKSVMEWLTRDAPMEYYVDAGDGARALAQWGWRDFREKGPANIPLYFLRHLPRHLAEAGQWNKLHRVLEKPNWIQTQCNKGLVCDLIQNLRLLVDYSRPATRVVKAMLKVFRKYLNERLKQQIRSALNQSFGSYSSWPSDFREKLEKSGDLGLILFLGETHDLEGSFDQAELVFRNLFNASAHTSDFDRYAIACARLTYVLSNRGRNEEALKIAEQFLQVTKIREQCASGLYWWVQQQHAVTLLRLDRFDEAMNLLDQIERHDTRAGHAVSAKHQMGVIYLELGCWAEAEREFKSCIEKRGNEIWDHRRAYEHRRLGEVYALTDRPEDARREFEMAFKISSNCGHLKYTKRLKKNESVFLDIPEWLRREKPERVNLENLAKRYGLEPTELAPAFRVLHRRDLAYIPEIADNTGEPTGCAVRWDVAHTAKGAWHPTVSVLIINQQGEVALQKRAEHDSKGKLDVSVSGHVEIGETDTRCAIREVLEEAGIFIGAARLKRLFQPWELVKMGSPRTAIDKHARFDRYQYKTQKTNRERTSVYLLCVSDDEWKKRRPDAMQMKWFSFTKAVQMAHKTPNRFASGFRQLVNPTIIEVIQKRIVESTRTTGKTNHPEV